MCPIGGKRACLVALGFAVLLGCTPARGLAAEPVRYAGIDVGSKGVKATIIEIVPGKANPVSSIYTKTTNPTVGLLKDGKFRQEAMAEVAADVDRFVKDFRSKYQVPLENIHVVGSSSLAEVPNRSGLVSEVEKRSGQKMSFIDVGREIRLSLEGLVLQGDKNQALLIDVGSGNTKGGYFTDLDKVETFSIPFGTVSFTTKIKNILNKGESFADVATKLRDKLLTSKLRQMAEAKPGLKKQSPVYLIGGITWAMATFLHPGQIESSLVPLSASDVKAFRKLLAANPGRFPTIDLSGVADAKARGLAETEAKRVADVFTPDNLVAGSEILQALVDAFGLENKPMFFARNGQVAWILAFVTPQAPTPPAPAEPRLAAAVKEVQALKKALEQADQKLTAQQKALAALDVQTEEKVHGLKKALEKAENKLANLAALDAQREKEIQDLKKVQQQADQKLAAQQKTLAALDAQTAKLMAKSEADIKKMTQLIDDRVAHQQKKLSTLETQLVKLMAASGKSDKEEIKKLAQQAMRLQEETKKVATQAGNGNKKAIEQIVKLSDRLDSELGLLSQGVARLQRESQAQRADLKKLEGRENQTEKKLNTETASVQGCLEENARLHAQLRGWWKDRCRGRRRTNSSRLRPWSPCGCPKRHACSSTMCLARCPHQSAPSSLHPWRLGVPTITSCVPRWARAKTIGRWCDG